MRKLLIGLLSTAALVCALPAQQSQAQILLVSGNYRVTELDQAHERFGVALPEAKPNETQNWVYLNTTTDIHRRVTNRQGWHKDDKLNYYQFFEQIRPGTMMRIHGGRRWDGEITAKKIDIGFPTVKD